MLCAIIYNFQNVSIYFEVKPSEKKIPRPNLIDTPASVPLLRWVPTGREILVQREMPGEYWCECSKCLTYSGGRKVGKTTWYAHNPRNRRTARGPSRLAGSSTQASKDPPLDALRRLPSGPNVKETPRNSVSASRAARSVDVSPIC